MIACYGQHARRCLWRTVLACGKHYYHTLPVRPRRRCHVHRGQHLCYPYNPSTLADSPVAGQDLHYWTTNVSCGHRLLNKDLAGLTNRCISSILLWAVLRRIDLDVAVFSIGNNGWKGKMAMAE